MCVCGMLCSANLSHPAPPYTTTSHSLHHLTASLQAKSRKLKAIERRVAAMTSHSLTVARQMAAAMAGTEQREILIQLQLCTSHCTSKLSTSTAYSVVCSISLRRPPQDPIRTTDIRDVILIFPSTFSFFLLWTVDLHSERTSRSLEEARLRSELDGETRRLLLIIDPTSPCPVLVFFSIYHL
jgi:hypothetical protein